MGNKTLKILRKEGDSIQLLCFPDEDVEKGDYVLIKDGTKERALITQIIDVQYANIPGILEDLLRDGISENFSREKTSIHSKYRHR